jgi:hypothetical protein
MPLATGKRGSSIKSPPAIGKRLSILWHNLPYTRGTRVCVTKSGALLPGRGGFCRPDENHITEGQDDLGAGEYSLYLLPHPKPSQHQYPQATRLTRMRMNLFIITCECLRIS